MKHVIHKNTTSSLRMFSTLSRFHESGVFIWLIFFLILLLIGVGSITEGKQRRSRLIIGWVTAWDCHVPYTLGHRAGMSCHGA